jgi:hypothetical protein
METELTKDHSEADIEAAREVQKQRRKDSFAIFRRLRERRRGRGSDDG